jgi:glycosyltransferase involved in cell wall biosynthesis
MKTAAVVTVTNGKRPWELSNCIASVKAQTYPVVHYIVCDEGFNQYAELRRLYPELRICYWDNFVGGKDVEGRRLYAASAFLVNEDVTFFCNDDDWYKPNHVQSIMAKIDEGYDWAYCLRSVYDKDGAYILDDDCEALGELHDCWQAQGHRFVDWCMWGMKTENLKMIASVLAQPGWGGDRKFYATAKQVFPKFTWSGERTFCFRLGGNEYSVDRGFFEKGNYTMLQKYDNKLPWLNHE